MVDDPAPADILAFWRAAGHDRWYKRDDAFDAELRRHYSELWQKAAAGELAAWEESDDGALALTIVLDQFPRNMFRNDPQAYSSDARIEADLREFLYMPFMHSEQLADQLRCVELFRETDNTENLEYAEQHADIIRQFGRFPHRNRVLGRMTTPEEQGFLDHGGFLGG
jgi:uncharacterized protein (DUF924 family)